MSEVMSARVAIARRRPQSKRLGVSLLIGDLLVVAVGLTATFVITVVGSLPISEILLLAALPILILVSGRRLRAPLFWRIFVLLLLWQMGEVLSDLFRQTAMNNWLRGSANIAFVIADFCGLAILLAGNRRRQTLFIASWAVGSILHAFLVPAITLGDPWKWGYSTGTTTLAALVAGHFYRQRRYGAVLVLMAAMIGADLVDNYRSAMLMALVTTVLVVPVVPERVGGLRLLPRAGTAARSAVLVLMTLAAGGTAIALVHWVTNSGLLSQQMEQKNKMEEDAKGGLLLGGRGEILITSQAVLASPIMGHGSWAKDPRLRAMFNAMQAENAGRNAQPVTNDLIPEHSHLMQAWVDDGILGAICWVYIFWLNARAVLRAPQLQTTLAPVYTLLLVSFAWAILFSPLGSTTRMADAFALVLILDIVGSTASNGSSRFFRRWTRHRPFRAASAPFPRRA